MPAIAAYDKFAIEWGYRPMPGEDMNSERSALSEMVSTMQQNPVYRFSSPSGADPTALTEAIGDDAMRASDYGIENLKRIVENLTEWTYEEGEDYADLQELYSNVIGQWNRYSGHVVTNIGGVVRTRKLQGQEGVPYEMVSKERQGRAMEYLNRQVFSTPDWLLESDIVDRFQGSGTPDLIRGRQVSALNQVLNVDRMKRLVEQEAFHGSEAYTLGEMMEYLRLGVWSEAGAGRATDAYRRNLQRAYVDRMAALMVDEDALQTDIAPSVRGQLGTLSTELQRAAGRVSHQATVLHYRDVIARIADILDTDE